jgi:hypothetical protein
VIPRASTAQGVRRAAGQPDRRRDLRDPNLDPAGGHESRNAGDAAKCGGCEAWNMAEFAVETLLATGGGIRPGLPLRDDWSMRA